MLEGGGSPFWTALGLGVRSHGEGLRSASRATFRKAIAARELGQTSGFCLLYLAFSPLMRSRMTERKFWRNMENAKVATASVDEDDARIEARMLTIVETRGAEKTC